MRIQRKHEVDTIRCGEPFVLSFRKRRQFPVTYANERSPEVAAMTAHLSATAYVEQKDGRGANWDHAGDGAMRVRPRSLLTLSRAYDSEARSNFVNEAFCFGIIIIVAWVWPFVQSVRVLTS